MHMEETQPESGAIESGGLGTDDTTLCEGVDPSSSAAAGDRLLGPPPQFFQYCMSWGPSRFVEEVERLVKDSASK